MFERFVCWDAAGASKILRPLALEGNEAIFRATHSPISGLAITGTEAHEVSGNTEEALLNALSSGERRHAMCIVEGEAGSGKSHLIRWLKVNWPGENDVVVLVERADGTLDGTLRQLNEKLAKDSGVSLDSIVPRHKLTEQGQRVSLLLQLGNLCRSGTLAEPLGDEEWCEKHGLSDMLQSEAVRTHWKAPERVLEVLTRGADRDSKVARFTARDVLELRQPLAGLRGKNVGPGAIRLAHLLRDESQAIASALEGSNAAGDEVDVSAVAPNTTKVLAALNSRLSLAIQSAMGISGAALQKMFRDLRRSLQKKGRRLVLLLEDLTGAQGIDQELLYVLQEKATTQDQFCDLVSVVGITPAYFRQYIGPQANVVQRVTHHVRFGKAEGSFQAVSALEQPHEQVAFASRYLRAVRAGSAEVEAAAREDSDVVNRCATCVHRPECHAAFGAFDGVGLYPLTEKAISRMFSALKHPQGAMFLQTPRAMIQGVLAPSIAAEKAILSGTFPVPGVETEWHPQAAREVRGLAHELIQKQPESQRDRLRLTVAWWGDGGFPVDEADGEWAGVPDGVFRAWGLQPPPPIPKTSQAAIVVPTPQPVEQPSHQTSSEAPPANAESSTRLPTGPKGHPKAVKRSPPKTKIDEQLERIRGWTKSSKIEDDGFWWSRALEFINRISWKHEDTSHWFATEALGEVRLAGSGKTDQRHVVIPCEEWAARGLEWSARLEYGKLAPPEYEVALQAISVFAQRVRELVRQWISSRVPDVQPGHPWQFGATVAQVLLVRAWLRGETRPGASLVEQWKVILSDDSTSGTVRRHGPQSSWKNSVEQLADESVLRKRIRDLAECNEAVSDVSFAAHAIQALAKEAAFSDFPETLPEQTRKAKWLGDLAASAGIAKKALSELPAKELTRLRERRARIREVLGTSSLAVYVARAAAAFGQVRQELPTHATGDLAEWFRNYESKQVLLKAGEGSEHDRLQAFLADPSLESIADSAPIPLLLDLVIPAPAESLDSIQVLIKATSELVNSLVDYLSQHEATAGSSQDAGRVLEFGQRIVARANGIKEALS